MTPEREKELRSWICPDNHCQDEILEMFAEIERLRQLLKDNQTHVCICDSCEAMSKAVKAP